MARGFFIFITVALATLAAAAGRDSATVPYREVQRVLDAKCTSCHTGSDAAQGLQLDSWATLMAGSSHGEAVIPFDAENSLLIELTTKLVGGPHPAELDAEQLAEHEVALLSDWVQEGARAESGEVPFADADQLLYVANQAAAMVSVIDMETNMVVRTVDLAELGFPPNASPHHVAVEPDGSFWYVSLIAANTVLKFNRENEVVGRLAFERPGLLALDPGSDKLYVGRSMAAVSPPQAIGVISRSDMTVEEVGVFVPRPHALAIGPGGRFVFTASLAVNQLVAVDPEEEAIELTTVEADHPHVVVQFAVSPRDRVMVGSTEVTSRLFLFDLDRVPDLTPVDTIDVNSAPWHPVFTPDGRWVYVGNNRANTVTVVDMRERKVAAVIEGTGLAQPHGSAVSSDGRYVYISSRNLEMPEGHTQYAHRYTPRYDLGDNTTAGTVVVIDTRTNMIVKIIEIEDYGSGMATAAMRR